MNIVFDLITTDYMNTNVLGATSAIMIVCITIAFALEYIYRSGSVFSRRDVSAKKVLDHNPPTLIGLRGKFGVGKDTAADYIASKYASHGINYEIIPFAAPLKHITAVVTSTTDESQYTREGKASIPKGLNNSVGYYQQLVGQTMRQIIHSDVWVRIAINYPAQYKIIPDVRHQNEVEAVEAAGGIVISITRPGVVLNDGRDTNHLSEIALDNYKFKYNVENNESLDNFREKISKILYRAHISENNESPENSGKK